MRRGYQKIHATFHVKSEGSAEDLEECARFSPVLDVVMHGTEVDLKVEKLERPARGVAASTEAQPTA